MNETDDNYNQLDSKSCQFINKNQEDEAVWILNHLIINNKEKFNDEKKRNV